MNQVPAEFRYPHRPAVRYILQRLARLTLNTLARFEVIGRENIPAGGPLLVVANHFDYADPVATIAALPYPLEFFAGSVRPAAPTWAKFIPELWKVYTVVRGTGSRYALKAAENVMRQNGVLAIFPEGGAWASVLRPPRPGAAFVAARTGVPVLPMSILGMSDIFPELRRGRRTTITIRIGRPFGAYTISGRGRERREQLDAIGHDIMEHIADLLPPEKRGVYSSNPTIRAAAEAVAAYPWDPSVEI